MNGIAQLQIGVAVRVPVVSAIVQVVSKWPFTAEVRVPSFACPRVIYYGQNATRVGLSASAFVFHVSVILPTPHTRSFICHRWYIILASSSVVK
jgi:hypothetical protein